MQKNLKLEIILIIRENLNKT